MGSLLELSEVWVLPAGDGGIWLSVPRAMISTLLSLHTPADYEREGVMDRDSSEA